MELFHPTYKWFLGQLCISQFTLLSRLMEIRWFWNRDFNGWVCRLWKQRSSLVHPPTLPETNIQASPLKIDGFPIVISSFQGAIFRWTMLNFGRVFLRPDLEVGRSQTWRSSVFPPSEVSHDVAPENDTQGRQAVAFPFGFQSLFQGANCYRRYVLRLSRKKQKWIEFIYWNLFLYEGFGHTMPLSGNRETDHGTATKTNDSLCISPNGIMIILTKIIIIFHKT